MAAWGHPGMAAVPAEITEEKLQEKGKLVVFCTIRKLSNVYLEPKGKHSLSFIADNDLSEQRTWTWIALSVT